MRVDFLNSCTLLSHSLVIRFTIIIVMNVSFLLVLLSFFSFSHLCLIFHYQQISDALTSKDDEIRDLRSKLADATREIDTCMSRMQEEETRFTSQIDSLREELHQVSTTARTREQENDLFIQKLHKDHEDLIQQLNLQHQSALNDLRNSLSNDSSAALRARDEEIREIEEVNHPLIDFHFFYLEM